MLVLACFSKKVRHLLDCNVVAQSAVRSLSPLYDYLSCLVAFARPKVPTIDVARVYLGLGLWWINNVQTGQEDAIFIPKFSTHYPSSRGIEQLSLERIFAQKVQIFTRREGGPRGCTRGSLWRVPLGWLRLFHNCSSFDTFAILQRQHSLTANFLTRITLAHQDPKNQN